MPGRGAERLGTNAHKRKSGREKKKKVKCISYFLWRKYTYGIRFMLKKILMSRKIDREEKKSKGKLD